MKEMQSNLSEFRKIEMVAAKQMEMREEMDAYEADLEKAI